MGKRAYVLFATAILAIVALLFAAGQDGVRSVKSDRLQIVASFYPLAFFAEEIAGNNADVYNLTPAGTEPHEYEPTPQDLARIQNADLLILNGAQWEPWAEHLAAAPATLVASEGLAALAIEDHGETETDPHTWLSPALARQIAERISARLSEADPGHRSDYEKNAANVLAGLDRLDSEYRQALAGCRLKDIVTSHAAFGYLASAYGLRQIPVTGVSPDEEPSVEEMARLTDHIRALGVKYIFAEELVNPELARAIARETGAEVLILNPLEGLTGAQLRAGEDYFTQMRANLANLTLALECPA